MRASQVNVGIGFDAVTVEKMMTNASKPVEFNFAGMELLIAHILKLIARLWHKRRRRKSYVFAFLKLGDCEIVNLFVPKLGTNR